MELGKQYVVHFKPTQCYMQLYLNLKKKKVLII